mmetsp:Transcript_34591/g.91951  ORF Transcript_34591/g.91951 Transcript_34591/m.91951 type:complete len:532 (+) Transcript_34591:580-2175(+)
MRGGPMSLEPSPHAPPSLGCARTGRKTRAIPPLPRLSLSLSLHCRGALRPRSRRTSPLIQLRPTSPATHTNTCAAAPPKVNFIETPDLPGRTLGESVIHSAPPPSPSTPSSVTPRPTWESYPQSEPLQGGASGSGAQKNDDAFGDEATNAIAELNTPSPTLPLKRQTGMMSASKSCDCVMSMAMRATPETSTMPSKQLADDMVSPTEGPSEAQTASSKMTETEVGTSSAFKSPASVTAARMPRSMTWPKLHSESENYEIIKRFTVTHKLGKPPSLLCCVSIPEPPSARSTDMASRWWWLLLFTAFLFSSTSGFLSTGPRLFTRASMSSTTSTVIHSPHNTPVDHDNGEAQFAHFTNFRANADPDAAANAAVAGARVHPLAPAVSLASWHPGTKSAAAGLVEAMEMAEQDVAQTGAATLGPTQDQPQEHEDELDLDLNKVQAAISKTVVHSVLMSSAVSSLRDTGNVNELKAKGRRDRAKAKWALREASRKGKEVLKVSEAVSSLKCDEYGCVLRDETADGVTSELVFQALR